MDQNELERRARRQLFRRVPDEWRGQILGAAGRALTDTSRATEHAARRSWWRELFWPCHQAWAGLAAVWAVILFLNVASREPVPVVGTPHTAPAREGLMALKERQRMLAELAGPPEPAEPPKPFAPGPRSELILRRAAV